MLKLESTKNKGRILALLQYLYKNTDEDHTVTTNELIEILSQAGYTANRKTIKDDIDIIIDTGFDVITVKSSSNSFFFGDRTFELPELKLLVDAVCSSRFISTSKSEQLIQKLSTLTSSNLSPQLIQRIYTKDRIKSTNSQLYYVIDKVTDAIQSGRKIQFRYTEYAADKEKVLRNDGECYINSPYALLWNEDYYYMIGYSEKRKKVITFRVDRMVEVEILNENAFPEPEDFHVVDFIRKVFEMYDGEEETVTLECENTLMKVIIDRFGEEVDTERISQEKFLANVSVSTSKTFYGWIFQFGGQIKIVGPEKVKREYIDMARAAIE
ncbi:MAG: hypothetical protein K0R50_1607 [Eubacterium sp.]|jgi:predicted DNA-binding transcriptional regulator YafY|nr:hypothetical protein [Eubacterium sp.]